MGYRAGQSRFEDFLIAQTIKNIEKQGPLEDGEEMSLAFRDRLKREERLLERSRLLGRRIGLDREWARWHEMATLVWLVLAALVFFMAYGIATALLGGGRSLNAVLAFFGVLGMHALTLVLWLAGLAISTVAQSRADSDKGDTGNRSGARLSLGKLFLRLLALAPVDRNPHSLTMARSANELIGRAGLAPWAFGFISHSIWAASFLLVLGALWFGFSFREYRLTWETTILHADFFIGFVQISGWLPGLFGFPVPDTSTLLHPGQAGAGQRAWALWLIGCTLIYGLLLRILLAMLCWAKWQHGKNRLRLDLSDPYFRKLLSRFEQMQASDILDREQRPDASSSLPSVPAGKRSILPALLGFELPEEFGWPPALPDILPSLAMDERIAGSGEERRRVLDRLAQIQPGKLLIACSLASTPDRGTERFLREAMGSAGQCALLMLARAEPPEQDMKRWRSWLVDVNMRGIMVFSDSAQAAAWLAKPPSDL